MAVRYQPDMVIGKLTLIECAGAASHSSSKPSWIVVCSCGERFKRKQCDLLVRAPMCRKCSRSEIGSPRQAAHLNRVPQRKCNTCGSIPDRVDGKRCVDCNLAYQPESAIHAVGDLVSSAGRAIDVG